MTLTALILDDAINWAEELTRDVDDRVTVAIMGDGPPQWIGVLSLLEAEAQEDAVIRRTRQIIREHFLLRRAAGRGDQWRVSLKTPTQALTRLAEQEGRQCTTR
jgi:hypothetical protein